MKGQPEGERHRELANQGNQGEAFAVASHALPMTLVRSFSRADLLPDIESRTVISERISVLELELEVELPLRW